MKFFSLHHCVLIFLTLIFTTAPASACEVPIWGKLHQPVTLPCGYNCAPRVARWNDLKTRSVFAQCDNTSCSSYKEGYKMSHDQYMKGDLSLTITPADYSKRNTYACECGTTDFSIQRLRILTVFSPVQMRPAEDLLLDLSVPEPVKVFYRSSDSADDELICNVTQSSAQCSSKYTSRTSLHHPQLTLRGVTSSDSGTYTIQSTEYNEDIIVYNVSVTGLSKGMITLIVVVLLLLLLLLVISGILIYRCIINMKVKRRMEEVKRIINQIVSVNKYTAEGQEELKKVIETTEKKINHLEEEYRWNRNHSARVKLYCSEHRSYLEIYKTLYLLDYIFPALTTEQQKEQMEEMKQKQEDIQQMKKRMEEVKRMINQIESVNKHTAEGQEEMKMLIERAEKKINHLQEEYREDWILSARVTLYCSKRRSELEIYKSLYLLDYMYPVLSTEEQKKQMEEMKQKQEDMQQMKKRMEEVKRIINQMESVNKYTAEGQKEVKKLIESAEKKINDLEEEYRENRILSARVTLYCSERRSDLQIYKILYVIDFMYPDLSTEQQEEQMEVNKQIEQMKQEDKQKMKRRMEEVKRIINQIETVNKHTAEGQEEMKILINRAEEKIKHLEEEYREDWILSARVKLYCSVCRSDLEIYKILYLIDHIFPALTTEEEEEQMEEIKQIEKIKREDVQQMKKRMEEVKRINNQIESVNKHTAEGQKEMKMLIDSAEKKIKHLENDYRENEILSARVTLYCSERRSDLDIYKILYLIDFISSALTTEQQEEQMEEIKQIEKMEREDVQQIKSPMKAVKKIINQIVSVNKYTVVGQEELMRLIVRAEKKIKHLEEDYRWNRIFTARVKLFCSVCRSDLDLYKTLYLIDHIFPQLSTEKRKKQMKVIEQIEQLKQEDVQQLKKRMEEVKRINNQIETVNKHTAEGQEEMKKLINRAEEKIKHLEKDYRGYRIHSACVKLYCSERRSDLEIYKIFYLIDFMFPALTTEQQEEQMKVIKQIEKIKREDIQQMKKRMEEVKLDINRIVSVNKYTAEGQKEMKKLIESAEEKINHLEEEYRWNRILSARVTLYCSERRSDLEIYKILYLIDFIFPALTTEEEEEQMKQMEKMKQEDVQQLKRRLAAVREDIKWIKSVKKAEGQEELKKVIVIAEEKIKHLEEEYRENRILSARVTLFCSERRSELKMYQTIYEKNMSTELYTTEQMETEELFMKIASVVKILQMLRRGESEEEQNRLYQRVQSDLEEIRDWCKEQREDLKSEQQQGGEGDSKAMRNMRALIFHIEDWCDKTQEELQRYSKKINADSAALLLPERDPESSPDQVEVLDEGVPLMSL